MGKIGIITDSACDLRKEDIASFTKVLPFKIIFSDGEFRDGVTITADETYRRMATEVPKTSLPSGQDMHEALEYFRDNGFTDVIAIMISSNLSGTFNAFMNIARDFEGIRIHGFDTKTLTVAEGVLVMYAQKLIEEGVEALEIMERLREKRKNVETYFVLDTLEYLIKGGRIGKVSGTIGQLLNIRPVIHVNENGIYHTVEKGRGKKQAVSKLISLLKEKYLVNGLHKVYVMHGGAPEEGKALHSVVAALDNLIAPEPGQITPSLGVHTGPGLVGFIIEKMF